MVRLLTKAIAARSCIGVSWEETWANLLAPRQRFSDMSGVFPDWPAGPGAAVIKGWEDSPPPYIARLTSLMRLTLTDLQPHLVRLFELNPGARCRVFVVSSHGDPALLSQLAARDKSPISSEVMKRILCDNLHDIVIDTLRVAAPVTVLHGACASGIIGVVSAQLAIETSTADVTVVLAADSLSLLAYAGFQNVGAMSARGCRPFQRNRDGMTAGEGAVGLILLNSECEAGGAPTVQVLGGLYNCDGAGVVEPSADGLVDVMLETLNGAGLAPDDVDFIYWHGTGTKLNDETEAAAAQRIWNRGPCPAGTASKGVLGHTMGASSAFSVAGAVETLTTGLLPPIGNTDSLEFETMNLVTNAPLKGDFKVGMCVAMGFGGINASLVLAGEAE